MCVELLEIYSPRMTGIRISSESEGESPEIALMRPIIEQSPSEETQIYFYYDEAGKTLMQVDFPHRTPLDFFVESNEGK